MLSFRFIGIVKLYFEHMREVILPCKKRRWYFEEHTDSSLPELLAQDRILSCNLVTDLEYF